MDGIPLLCIRSGACCVLALIGGHADAGSYRAIYRFNLGEQPKGGLIEDTGGRLIGTTSYGGAFGYGTVFRLKRPIDGTGLWTKEILHDFGKSDGAHPEAPVTLGADGFLYGTASSGGAKTVGVVFKLENSPGGLYSVLHNFGYGSEGDPVSGVTFGSNGLLYGTTVYTAFSISPLGDDAYYRVLHVFGGAGDGYVPSALVQAPSPHGMEFLGANAQGNDGVAQGNIFRLVVLASGAAAYAPLHTFGVAPDVGHPLEAPVLGAFDTAGNAYGCGITGGANKVGGVYQVSRNDAGSAAETIIYSLGSYPNDAAVGSDGQCFIARVRAFSG